MEQFANRCNTTMKLLLDAPNGDFDLIQSCSEPCSPDSGFSSDDSITSDLSFTDRLARSKTLPSALRRRSRSKQNVKRVRFADSLGLDLENLQYFVNEEKSHLNSYPRFSLTHPVDGNQPKNRLPSRLAISNFFYRSPHEYNDRTRMSRVCVTALRTSANSIVGQVNLLNLAFNKLVIIRYSTDNWTSQNEVCANYSHRMFSTDDIDAFNFTIQIPAKVLTGKCEFCVQYKANGEEWWDNNDGSNYIIDIFTSSEEQTKCPEILPMFGTMSMNKSAKAKSTIGTFPAVPCTRISSNSSRRQQQRRWGKSLDESDDEMSALVYVPTKKSF